MKKMVALVVLCLTFAFAGHVLAGEYGSRAEAKAMAEKAAALIKDVGMDAAVKQFHDMQGDFIDRDLYVFAYDDEGKVLAFGVKQFLVGKPMWNLKDIEGRLIVQEFLALKPGTAEWISYKWQNPVSERIDKKDTYIIREDGYFVGVGYYTEAFYQAENE